MVCLWEFSIADGSSWTVSKNVTLCGDSAATSGHDSKLMKGALDFRNVAFRCREWAWTELEREFATLADDSIKNTAVRKHNAMDCVLRNVRQKSFFGFIQATDAQTKVTENTSPTVVYRWDENENKSQWGGFRRTQDAPAKDLEQYFIWGVIFTNKWKA